MSVSVRVTTRLTAAVLFLASCSGEAGPVSGKDTLPEGVAAKVGKRSISALSIARIAAVQRIELNAARELAIRDALLAEQAASSGLAELADVESAVSGVLARKILRELHERALEAPISDEEIRRATERRWLEVERPEGFRSAHAVVRVSPDASESRRKQASAIAEAIRTAVLPLRERAATMPMRAWDPVRSPRRGEEPDALADAFQKSAEPISHDDFEVVVQPLAPVTVDGRTLTLDGQTFDPIFSRAVAALRERGDISPVVMSPFGAHVIILLERVPPSHLTAEERARLLHRDIVNERARTAAERLLAGRREQAVVSSDADALLALIDVDK